MRLQQVNKYEYSENVEQMVDDCLWQEKKQALMTRIEELRRTLIPAAEQKNDVTLAKELTYELVDLQVKVRARR